MRDWALIPWYFAKAFTDGAFWKWMVATIAVILDWVFGPGIARDTAVGAGLMLVLDTITGGVAARYRKEPFESGKASRILVKGIAYGASLIVAATVPRCLPGLAAWHDESVTACASIILLTEALSVLENINKMGFKRMGWLKTFLMGRMKELQQIDKEGE
jgi:phage-related holin